MDVYPNPADDFVELQLPYSEDSYEVSIVDLSGKTVLSQVVSGGKSKIATEKIVSGMYLMHVKCEEINVNQTIVILH